MNISLKERLKISLILSLIGGIASGIILPYLVATVPPDMLEKYPMPFPPMILGVLMGIQGFVMLFVLGFIGLTLGQKVGLGTPIFLSKIKEKKWNLNTKWILSSSILGILTGLLVILIESKIFVEIIPELENSQSEVAMWKSVLAIFYGGITEEIIMRLFFLTLVAWILTKLFSKGKQPNNSIFWVAIVLSAIVFGVLHLPATTVIFGELNTWLIIRGLVLNMLPALVFGFLYWKRGLEYAMIAHLFADIVLHVIF